MAYSTGKMGLRVWDQLTDPYDHNQLADNLNKLDLHDHTPGRGVLIPTEGIADGAITTSKLDPAVTLSIADNSVTTIKLVDGSVTTPKISDGSVTVAKTGTAANGLALGSFSVWLQGAANIAASSVPTVVPFDTAEWDVNNGVSAPWLKLTGTPGRFIPQIPGYYRISSHIETTGTSIPTTEYLYLYIYKNGTYYRTLDYRLGLGSSTSNVAGSTVVKLNGTTDYVEIQAAQTLGSTVAFRTAASAKYTYAQGELIGLS